MEDCRVQDSPKEVQNIVEFEIVQTRRWKGLASTQRSCINLYNIPICRKEGKRVQAQSKLGENGENKGKELDSGMAPQISKSCTKR